MKLPSTRPLVAFAALLALAVTLYADTYHDAPDPSAKGGITGKVIAPEALQAVIACEPTGFKSYMATLDTKTGQFSFRGLPPGEYDLLIKSVGKVYEGITLETEPDQAPSAKDLKTMLDGASKTYFTLEDYFHIKKIVRLTGTGEKARMFTVQTRTRPTLTPGAEKINANIRRFDIVEMTKTNKVWQLSNSRFLLRQEVPFGDADNQLTCVHLPKLGGILVGESVKNVGDLDVAKLPKGKAEKYVGAEYKAKD